MDDAEDTGRATRTTVEQAAVDGPAIEKRVHVDLPRVRPEDMVTTQAVTPPTDPLAGRDTETEFMLRNAGW